MPSSTPSPIRSPRRSLAAAVLLALACVPVSADGPEVWSGEDVTFVKEDFAPPGNPANQDRITPGVWLTRGSDQGLLNYAEEFAWEPRSPWGTEWAFGAAEDWEDLVFHDWYDWCRNNPSLIVGRPAVLHLLEKDAYLDVLFTAYDGSGSGGAFSWERATEGVPGEKVWTGETLAFSKAAYADIGLPANQDRIVEGVWLTRNDRREIFNVAREASSDYEDSTLAPSGTEWAWGTTDDLAHLVFAPWRTWTGQHPPGMVGKSAVLHLLAEDAYLDIRFLAWTSGNGGGGFSYERSTEGVPGETIWTGPPSTFTKADYADWKLEENQDRITDDVWITRQNSRGIFNIRKESSFYSEGAEPGSPYNTEWAYGSADDWEYLTFRNWYEWHGGNPASTVGQDAVLHLIHEDVYLDIRFTSFSGGGSGGGFSYLRSTEGVPGQKVWTGAPTTFTRPDDVDWRAPANQDRITRHTWIARQNTSGLFNASFERGYEAGDQFPSPVLAEFAFGSAADWESLTFQPFRNWRSSPTPGIVGQDAVLHLLDEDVYLDIRFTSWTLGGEGGGFSYERATEGSPGEKVWTGPTIAFSKKDGADVGLPENQDRITPEVWLTRRDEAGLINATREPGYEFQWASSLGIPSPLGTEWAIGRAADGQSLTFYPWYAFTRRWRNANTPDVVGTSAVLHLLEEDAFLDIRFTGWTANDNGGGFSYVRATEGVPGEKVWTGAPLSFAKPDHASPDAASDAITPGVRIARADRRGIYNAEMESGWETPLGATSGETAFPTGTEWAFGRAEDWQDLVFSPWKSWHGGNPLSALGRPAVLHLLEEDVYLDITFTAWTSNGNGGGFAYTRASRKTPLVALKASGKVDFASAGRDSLKLKGEIPLPDTFEPEGEEVSLDAGGTPATFTLDARGRGATGDGNGTISLKYNARSGTWKFKASLRNGSFAGDWEDEGMVDGTLLVPVRWRLAVYAGGEAFADGRTYTWKAKKGRSGTFK